jgi:hypothetical protein
MTNKSFPPPPEKQQQRHTLEQKVFFSFIFNLKMLLK